MRFALAWREYNDGYVVRRFLDYIVDGESLLERRVRHACRSNPLVGVLGWLGSGDEHAAARLLLEKDPDMGDRTGIYICAIDADPLLRHDRSSNPARRRRDRLARPGRRVTGRRRTGAHSDEVDARRLQLHPGSTSSLAMAEPSARPRRRRGLPRRLPGLARTALRRSGVPRGDHPSAGAAADIALGGARKPRCTIAGAPSRAGASSCLGPTRSGMERAAVCTGRPYVILGRCELMDRRQTRCRPSVMS
jgi:hypothetical protein